MIEETGTQHKFFYPPGGILIWIIIYLELMTFGAALAVMAFYSRDESALFHASRMKLNSTLGAINTVVLLCSGYFMAKAIEKARKGLNKQLSVYLRRTMLLGLLFVSFKSIEYYEKLDAGIDFLSNNFFTFYWSLTIFHLAHVLVGLGILFYFMRLQTKGKTILITDLEAGAAFWHLCDLIWLLIFPTLYLFY
jgi:nitric oxide reductase NorE protein